MYLYISIDSYSQFTHQISKIAGCIACTPHKHFWFTFKNNLRLRVINGHFLLFPPEHRFDSFLEWDWN